jgi:AhpD family alkylhydroperoxidase
MMNKNTLLHPDLLAKTALYQSWSPKQAEAFKNLAQTCFNDGALNRLEKELIAVGSAHTLKCPYCIDYHIDLAYKAGAAKEQLIEAAWIGISMSARACLDITPVTLDALNRAVKTYSSENDNEKIQQFSLLNQACNEAFINLENVTLKTGAIDIELKQLIALACSHNLKSPLTIQKLAEGAVELKLSNEKIAESVWVAIEMEAGACFGHSGLTAKLLEERV